MPAIFPSPGRFRLSAWLWICVTVGAFPVAADESRVTVRPRQTDELLANPGIGWTTFNRTSRADKNLPDGIPSTIAYTRWSWRQLEPRPGQIDEPLIAATLRDCRAAGQKLSLRVKCCNPVKERPDHPAWLEADAGQVLLVDYDGSGPEIAIPDMDHPIVLRRHLDFIRRLGDAYDGHPDIETIDIGSIGWWGEWHFSRSTRAKLPTLENRRKVLDAYLAAFRKTPLIMLIGAGEMTRHAIGHGTGWRADSLGDLGSFSASWNHMQRLYPAAIRDNHMEQAWKSGPIAFEPPRNVSEFVERGWPIRGIFNYALALHGSSFNGKSAALPDDPALRGELERFLRRLGYRYVLEEFSYPARAAPGGRIELSMRWRNIGSAPCYRPYRLAYRLGHASGSNRIFVGPRTARELPPGSIPDFVESLTTVYAKDFGQGPPDLPPGPAVGMEESLSLPADMPAGDYTLSVGIVGEQDETPAIRLGIAGRDEQGWYPLGTITVQP